jgi:hypothetical protein
VETRYYLDCLASTEEIPVLSGTLQIPAEPIHGNGGKMAAPFGWHRLRITPFLLGFLTVLACSDDGTGIETGLKPLIGVWEARVFEVPNPENLLETLDVVQEGGSYVLSILGSGQYTAVFDLVLLRGFEVGTIKVSGQSINLTPTTPPGGVMSGSWMFEGDILIVEAFREIDLDLDGEDELVPFYVEFLAREE